MFRLLQVLNRLISIDHGNKHKNVFESHPVGYAEDHAGECGYTVCVFIILLARC